MNNIHLVYVGGLPLNDDETESIWTFYKKITKQEMHLHIYSKQPKEVLDRMKTIEEEDKYFHYEGYMEHKKLIKELTKYDYMIAIADYKNTPIVWQKTVFGFKIYDAIMAKIPYINPKNLTAMADFIDENGIGMNYDYSKIERLKEYLQ